MRDVRDRFLKDIDAKHIARDAFHKDIIAEGHVTKIQEAKSVREANEILFVHVFQQTTMSSLKELCLIMICAKGYARMSEFGQMLHDEVSILVDWTLIAAELLSAHINAYGVQPLYYVCAQFMGLSYYSCINTPCMRIL